MYPDIHNHKKLSWKSGGKEAGSFQKLRQDLKQQSTVDVSLYGNEARFQPQQRIANAAGNLSKAFKHLN